MGESIGVLYVAEEAETAALARNSLEGRNDRLRVETATGPADGLDRLAAAEIDCVVFEGRAPDADAIGFLDAVRENYPDLPVILLSGTVSENVATVAVSEGVTESLENNGPDGYAWLANRIEPLVAHRRAGMSDRPRLETLTETLPEVVYRAVPGTLQATYVTDPIESLTGYTPEEWLDRPELWKESIHPADTDYVIEALADARDDGRDVVLEYRLVRNDGEVRWVSDRFDWERDESGEARGRVGVMVDVTEPLQRDRELETLTDDLEQLHWATNRIHAAESTEECLEITIDTGVNILGMDWCSLVALAEDEDVFELKAVSEHGTAELNNRPFGIDEGIARRVYQTGESHIADDIADAADTQPIDGTIRSALTVPVGDWGIFHAMSTESGAFNELDRSRAELFCTSLATALEHLEHRRALERQNERLEQFSSIVSHDLRNPLTVAEGRLKLARSEVDSDHLDAVADAQERMSRLIEDLLTFARVGQAALDIEPVDVGDLAEVRWREVDAAEATLEVPSQLEVMADRERLRQLLGNLLENAVEHGGEGVTVTIGRLPDGFYVEDDGVGIPEEKVAETFDPAYSTAAEGTGFGLSIVSEIAGAHDWEIDVTTSDAGGARFEFTRVEFPD